MAELIKKKMLRDVAVPLTKAENVNGRVYVDFQCLFENIDNMPTTTEAEIRASVIDEFAEKLMQRVSVIFNNGHEYINAKYVGKIAEQLKESE